MFNGYHNQKSIRLLLIIISVLYFSAFIPINRSGSDELGKIRIFSNLDEYVQKAALDKMLQPRETVKRAIGEFFLHHHPYGYPFYFVSAVAAVPVKLLHLSKPDELTWTMLLLRQEVVLFNVITCLLLVYLFTGYSRITPTVLLYLFLLCIPAVVKHNMIWHPDALSTLFITLTIFFLVKDNYRLGKWFLVSAVACGFVCSVKYLGPFIFPMVIIYIVIANAKNELTGVQSVKRGVTYFITTAVTFLITTPLILFGYGRTIYRFLFYQSKEVEHGWGVEMTKGLGAWYNEIIHPLFFNAWIVTGLVILAVYCIMRKESRRTLNVLILSAIIPLFIFVVSTIAFKNYFYLYPVMLLLAGTAGNVFSIYNLESRTRILQPIAMTVIALLIIVNSVSAYNIYKEQETTIATHPALSFYRKLNNDKILADFGSRKVKVIQSIYIYLPDSLQADVVASTPLINKELVQNENPDLIIFERTVAENFTNPAFCNSYFQKEAATLAGQFYNMALHDSMPGYTVKTADDYAIALERVNR